MRALIEQLRTAEKGSRELDEAISKAVGDMPENAVFLYHDPETGTANYEWPTTDTQMLRVYAEHGWRETPTDFFFGRDYTQSIDTAVLLVPDGLLWSVGRRLNAPGFVAKFAQDAASAVGATAALAICILCLDARLD